MPNGQGEGQWEARRDRAWTYAWIYGAGFIKSLGIDPSKGKNQLTEEEINKLNEAIFVRQQGEAKQRLPQAREQWLSQWQVPQAEQKGWREYPLEYGAGTYYPTEQRAEAPPQPEVIGHELAHATYFEQMPKAMRSVYPIAQRVGEAINPEYKEAVESYGAEGLEKYGRATEGYAQTYGRLGKEPERMPWYMEPFYGNLMYEVPDLPGDWEKNWASWLGYWLKSKLEKQSEKVQASWRTWFERMRT